MLSDIKDNGYYLHEKSVVADLIPVGKHSIIDVGCAAGRLGKKLRESGKVERLIGVEINEEAAEKARAWYDEVLIADLETDVLSHLSAFDYALCCDILEHVRYPDKLLTKLAALLKPNGFLIATLPNIRYWQILFDLAINGKWEYRNSGILDNTHFRFFTRRSLSFMFSKCNFRVLKTSILIHGKKKNAANVLTIGFFKEFLGSQILIVSQKML